MLDRRKLIKSGIAAAAGASGLAVAARLANQYGLVPPDHGGIYGVGETLTYASQRLLTSRYSLAREFSRNDISRIAPVNGEPGCEIRNLVLVEREDGPKEFSLPSGKVILFGFTGVTDAELVFAKSDGSPALVDRLRAAGCHPITNPNRKSLF